MFNSGGNKLIGTPCKRCQKDPSVVISRKDNFCKLCFIRFIRGKQRKQMLDEKFKVKFNNSSNKRQVETPNVLLPLSFGESSLVLFDIIVSLLEEQYQQIGGETSRGSLGFNLVVACINQPGFTTLEELNLKVDQLKDQYKDSLDHLRIRFRVVDANKFLNNGGELETIVLSNDFQSHLEDFNINKNEVEGGKTIDLQYILSKCKDKSSREDFLSVIIKELIIRVSVVENCSVVLFGHSVTKLADDILSLTVRGRGSEIANKLKDGEDYKFDDGSKLHIIHPLRDVLFSEIKSYSELSSLEQFRLAAELENEQSVKLKSARNKTVNELIRQYFRTVEVTYPEVISTVVKIGSQLANPIEDVVEYTDGENGKNCVLCHEFLYNDPKHWLEQITVQGFSKLETQEEFDNLKLYLEYIGGGVEQEEAVDSIGDGSSSIIHQNQNVPLCYGCMVSLGMTGNSGFAWPVHRPSKQEILDEFVLTDDDDDDDDDDE